VVARLTEGSEVIADEVMVSVGRRANTARLGVETVGLRPGEPLPVDEHQRVQGNDWLYAIGDVTGHAMFTHLGKYHARVAADHILGRKQSDTAMADPRAVPRVVFTDPQVAAVGFTERQARERGLPVRTVAYGTGDVAGAEVQGHDVWGTSQLVVDPERGVVVGATFVGHGVAELLHSATIAIVGEVPLARLWHAVPAFPTVSEVWLRLLETYGL
jgi:dihydrolipoamide dehydrogenase